jgi:hypothetical protein
VRRIGIVRALTFAPLIAHGIATISVSVKFAVQQPNYNNDGMKRGNHAFDDYLQAGVAE